MSSDSPLDITEWRKAQRARLLELRRTMPLDRYGSAGEAIMQTLVARLPPACQNLVGCYWPFRREFNCIPFMRAVLRAGGQVALPVVITRGRPLEFRGWTEDCKMEPGVWNIPHPAAGPAVYPVTLVIPLVGFDEDCFRLGYGAGYYDATLASFPERPLAIGVGFEFSCLSTIHPQSHDWPMDAVITETGLRERAK